ncbi:MAG: hypothetical protein Q8L64_05620 [bacterium]|nr:hypothetical protein [bacterium]
MIMLDKINRDDVLTVGVFERLLDEKLETKLDAKLDEKLDTKLGRLEAKMMEGFEMVFDGFERLERKIDDLAIRKADREDVLTLHSRITRLEQR